MKWKFGNSLKSKPRNFATERLRIFGTKKPRIVETEQTKNKKPRHQEATKQTTNKPRNTETEKARKPSNQQPIN